MNEEQERAEFEAAAYARYLAERARLAGEGGVLTDDALIPHTKGEFCWRHPTGVYGVLNLNAAWWGWRTMAASLASMITEVLKDLDHICVYGDSGSQETAHDARDRLRAALRLKEPHP